MTDAHPGWPYPLHLHIAHMSELVRAAYFIRYLL